MLVVYTKKKTKEKEKRKEYCPKSAVELDTRFSAFCFNYPDNSIYRNISLSQCSDTLANSLHVLLNSLFYIHPGNKLLKKVSGGSAKTTEKYCVLKRCI